jgi:carbamoyl-phosphate synthase large subunit
LRIDVPKTSVIYDTEQLHPVDGWSFPLFIKGSLADAEPAHNEEEAAYLFKRMAKRWGYPVMAQEARSGVEYLLSGVCRENSEPSALLSIRKVRTTGLGKATAAVTVHDAELEKTGRKILSDLNWRGPFELEFLKDTANDRLYLIEINARFPAWISFSQALGFDVAGDLVRMALGEDTPFREAPPAGTHFTRAFQRDVGQLSDRRVMDALAAATREPLVS